MAAFSFTRILITGLGLEIPRLDAPEQLHHGRATWDEAREFDPKPLLGRKGLLGKDQATRLALCAAQRALIDADLPVAAEARVEPERFAALVSCNFGNLDTVARVVDTLHASHVRELSMLDAPNASSNVIASNLAIRFRLQGPNLMLCSGASSGTEALWLGANLLRAGRAERALVVGVEVDNPVIRRLWESEPEFGGRLFEGAAAILLETEPAAHSRGARARGQLLAESFASQLTAALPRAALADYRPGLWLTPGSGALPEPLPDVFPRAPELLPLEPTCGQVYGALGVLQAAVGCLWLAEQPGAAAFAATCGGFRGGDFGTILVGGATC